MRLNLKSLMVKGREVRIGMVNWCESCDSCIEMIEIDPQDSGYTVFAIR